MTLHVLLLAYTVISQTHQWPVFLNYTGVIWPLANNSSVIFRVVFFTTPSSYTGVIAYCSNNPGTWEGYLCIYLRYMCIVDKY